MTARQHDDARRAQAADPMGLARGFVGAETDDTPNENYTAAGVASGAPTPETDPDLARAVGNHRFGGPR